NLIDPPDMYGGFTIAEKIISHGRQPHDMIQVNMGDQYISDLLLCPQIQHGSHRPRINEQGVVD
ncbi:MAG: hypothetical protein O6918_05795, partial [Deltaproteobacteria bacterium]|nr:hypothetical protein [Deltaproteobacteria bacterium]